MSPRPFWSAVSAKAECGTDVEFGRDFAPWDDSDAGPLLSAHSVDFHCKSSFADDLSREMYKSPARWSSPREPP